MTPRYCANCERKIVVQINTKRNPGSVFSANAKTLKDHDLCQRCFRSMMERERVKV